MKEKERERGRETERKRKGEHRDYVGVSSKKGK